MNATERDAMIERAMERLALRREREAAEEKKAVKNAFAPTGVVKR